MATVVMMPRLSPTMEEGVLLKWTKKPGDKISAGDVIAEVETDKANMDFPYEDEGTLLKQLVREGETVKLGAPVAVVGDPGEDADAAVAAATGAAAPTAKAAEAPAAKAAAPAVKAAAAPAAKAAPEPAVSLENHSEGTTQPTNVPTAAAPAPAPAATGNGHAEGARASGFRASPLARKLAYEKGVDLKSVAGSGPGGRVVKRDIEAAATAKPATAPTAARALAPADVTVPLSPMRKTVARRLTESKQTVPHFYVTMDAAADAVWSLWQQVKDAGDVKITLNDLILKAVATALSRLPEANVSFSDAGIVRHGRIDLGIAVSIEDGLVTPVLRAADQKSLGTIARESRDLIDRARSRKLRGDEFTGSTFSVSNMGMLGVKSFSAVINPPESGILAVGAVDKRAVVVTGADGADRIEARRMMTLTLSADHRAVDGALAAKLLGEIVKAIEHPMAMLL